MKTKLAMEILFHVSCRLDLVVLVRLLSVYDLLSVYRLSEVKNSRLWVILHLLYFKWVVS